MSIFTYADVKATVAKDNFPNLSPGNEWTGTDIESFIAFMKWHRPDLPTRFVLAGLEFQESLQPILKTIDPDFPGPVPTPAVPPVIPHIVSILVMGSRFAKVGVETNYLAFATMSDGGSQDITRTCGWTSRNIHVITVDRFGVVNARTTGVTTIRASQGGVTSPDFQVTGVEILPDLLVESIEVSGPASVADGATAQYTATATMNDSTTEDVTSIVVWSSSSAATATIDGTGLLTALDAGTTNISAALTTDAGPIVSPDLAVTVAAATVVSVAITGADTVVEGATSQYTATATMSDGETQDVTTTAIWASGTTGTATIDAAGLLTAVAAGTTGLTAVFGGLASPPKEVTVTAP